jgi:hypothetical protein
MLFRDVPQPVVYTRIGIRRLRPRLSEKFLRTCDHLIYDAKFSDVSPAPHRDCVFFLVSFPATCPDTGIATPDRNSREALGQLPSSAVQKQHALQVFGPPTVA